MQTEIHRKFSRYYDKLYQFKNYGEQTVKLVDAIRHVHPAACSLLEIACGTGLYTQHLKDSFEVEGLDISTDMLEIARRKFPLQTFYQADMHDFSLGRRYDVVACLFSSIAYARTEENLFRAMDAMSRHLAPGGVLVIEPFFTRETYWTNHLVMNLVQEPELKISWMYVMERVGDEARLDYHFTVGTPAGIEHFTERHELALFSRQVIESTYRRLGMRVEFDPVGHAGRGLYIGVMPA